MLEHIGEVLLGVILMVGFISLRYILESVQINLCEKSQSYARYERRWRSS